MTTHEPLQPQRISPDGTFPNGVTASAVVQFVRDYDHTARIEDVAAHFHLGVEDVCAALDHSAQHLNDRRPTDPHHSR